MTAARPLDASRLVAGGERWRRMGRVVLPRGPAGSFDSGIVGDPCIVWDDAVGTWRMFYFALGESFVGTGVAVARSPHEVDAGDWSKAGRLPIEGALADHAHKFWVLTDPRRPGHAARIDGEHVAFFTVFAGGAKAVGRARAAQLAGPWRTDAQPVILPGRADACDARGADAVTAYWFAERGCALLFYMAYPDQPQAEQPASPLGPCQAVAILEPGAAEAEKLGPILRPGGWCRGWIGGLQLLPGEDAGWVGLLNGSPTPVHEGHGEPDPSLGGWARSARPFPDGGWALDRAHSPIERPDQLSDAERQTGESTNFWRHHLLALPDGRARIYYNSGEYGAEQIYAREFPSEGKG